MGLERPRACSQSPRSAERRSEVRIAPGPKGRARAAGLGAWCAPAARRPHRAGKCRVSSSAALLPRCGGRCLWLERFVEETGLELVAQRAP